MNIKRVKWTEPVSAILLAGKTPLFQLQSAVNCFAAQTHRYKELIIIGNHGRHRDAVEQLMLPTDREGHTLAHVLDTGTQLTAGACRSCGVAAATHDLIIQWDADCWHSPQRITAQMSAMRRHRADICVLARGIQYNCSSGIAAYWANDKNIIPQSTMFKRSDITYNNLDKLEEVGLLLAMIDAGSRPIALDRPDLLCKIYCPMPATIKPISWPGDRLSDKHMRLVRRIAKIGV